MSGKDEKPYYFSDTVQKDFAYIGSFNPLSTPMK